MELDGGTTTAGTPCQQADSQTAEFPTLVEAWPTMQGETEGQDQIAGLQPSSQSYPRQAL